MSDDKMVFTGVVADHCKDIFRVQLDGATTVVKAKISGKMRLNKINLQVGDQVRVEVSPYDPTMGRIISRLKTLKEQARAAQAALDSEGRGRDQD